MDLRTRPATAAVASADSGVVTRPFAVAVLLLGSAACLVGPVANWLDINPGKQAIPLRVPLSALDEEALVPFRVVRRNVLQPVLVEALGTDKYVSWLMEDTSVSSDDSLRYANLLITYDTGGNNLVPHTPEICWFGGGYKRAQPHDTLQLRLTSPRLGQATVPIRVCTFVKTALHNRSKESVVYTFHCNGEFVAARTAVRVLLNHPRNRFAYFSKIEVSFPDATRTESVEGARKLFERLLPQLVNEHLPRFAEAERAARQTTTVEK